MIEDIARLSHKKKNEFQMSLCKYNKLLYNKDDNVNNRVLFRSVSENILFKNWITTIKIFHKRKKKDKKEKEKTICTWTLGGRTNCKMIIRLCIILFANSAFLKLNFFYFLVK